MKNDLSNMLAGVGRDGIRGRSLSPSAPRSPLPAMLSIVALSVAALPGPSSAGIIGFLGNFDVINDTGTTAHGFEIDLGGLHASDITDVFGGPGRGFPTGRGFDPATSVERYGAPTITEYTTATGFGTKVTYQGLWSGTSWDFGTPSGTFVTPGDNCWSGGGLPGAGYGPGTPCDHFGVGTIGTPTQTTYSWLVETATPGVLTNGALALPAPTWTVTPAPPPPPGNPPAPPVNVVAQIVAPDPLPGLEFGDALWVKVFTTELDNEVALEDLVGGNPNVEAAQTEIEWQLLQKEVGNPASGMLESGDGAPIGANAESILRRYEYYAFSGSYDPQSHEALFDIGFGDTNPGPDDVGSYLGSQNAAINFFAAAPIAGVPEPSTLGLLAAGLASVLLRRSATRRPAVVVARARSRRRA